MHTPRGFTLTELMIAVAIVGILSTVAYPSYKSSVQRGQCSQGQQFLMEVADRQSQYFFTARAYATNLASQLNMTVPVAVGNHFNAPVVAVNNAASPPTFVVTLTPRASDMLKECTLKINSATQTWIDADGNNNYDPGADRGWK